jgi:hypothetical protein
MLLETIICRKIMHLRMKVVAFVEIPSSIEEFWIVANTGTASITHLHFPTVSLL